MGFLKSLFGGSNSAPNDRKEMEGTKHFMIDLLRQCTYVSRLEEQTLNHPAGRAGYVWTLHKQMEFLNQFAEQAFFFDGEVKSMCIANFNVKQDLTGYINAGIYSQSVDEINERTSKYGEPPEPVGNITLTFDHGRPLIDITKWSGAPGTPNKWTNRNKGA